MTDRILIVDDNLLNLKLAKELLVIAGFAVETAMDADEARAALDAAIPDLILMDISLPGMDGLTLTRLLKSEARFARLPIVALTAFAMKGDEQLALASGCDGYIAKPVDARRFATQVREILQRARTAGGPNAPGAA